MDFSLEVAKKALNHNSSSVNKNMICSPFSISTTLNALVAGAKGNTLEKLLGLLGYNNMEEVIAMASKSASVVKSNGVSGGGPIIAYANGVWLDRKFSLNSSYKEFLLRIFEVQPKVVDFQAKLFLVKPYEVVKDVNSWINEQTNGFIPKVLSSNHTFNQDIVMFLANALYFKGKWATTFDSSMTQNRRFHLLNGDTVQVPLMKKSNCMYEYGSYKGCKTNTCGLPKLMENIKLSNNMFDNEQIKLTNINIGNVLLPKFKFESSIELSSVMKELGLTLPFEYPGELTKIVDLPSELSDLIFVSDIVQSCRIETNETGTEAACFTRKRFATGCAPPSSLDFIVDHPFMFMIREDHFGKILFMGTVYNPLLD
ncbi:serpin-Z2B-like [Chenopodium quinoa]|uniref:serpin-Z2B-like n=1 Tax=Chenopodium quinoa TaxID=63459 RepID=UPI000B791284|nr:serpin-Z2B-like [Chenopodium quinoa]